MTGITYQTRECSRLYRWRVAKPFASGLAGMRPEWNRLAYIIKGEKTK